MSEGCQTKPVLERLSTDVAEMKVDMKEIRVDLNLHMSRSAAAEARQDIIEDFVKQAMDSSQSNFQAMLQSNKENQEALNKQLKLALGAITAITAFFTAVLPLLLKLID